ncbi:MAG: NAD(P)-dependent oxidoreductase [Acidimicrobiia bacterium]|nr:NAD(P)-dependent oxidoreductase [bacterium]MXZ29291.1 NAD(P)-dependent oxidoreductase [Acidimicrobiia bacterium]MYB24485.1 NAD(P)-dependent oxidoreductase [Acidimicrobiia bacterium]MYE67803.1 NAD(P)-dependent oxidoreductase [Acidimicrobiia bacterium]MYJ14196.1 NAD(P)-dependent oxidoreductase [Acidimicrobiia bacterium]
MSIANRAPSDVAIGWIGTGVMGAAMCGHLMDAGHPATVHTRTRAKAEGLLARGAAWADRPRDVAEASDVIFTIVGYPADVREVILGTDGVLAGCGGGEIIVDMTTSEPALAVEIAAAAAARGVAAVDAPVSGGDVGARGGTLSIMIGGDAETVASLAPFWEAMGRTWVHQGGPGAGQHTKMVNQTLIAAGMVSVCEGLLYAWRAGLDLETVMESVASGAAGSWSLSNLGARMIAGDFDPGFFVEHFVKDMGIALAEADRMGLDLPGLRLARGFYDRLVAADRGRLGTQSLICALAELSNLDWTTR